MSFESELYITTYDGQWLSEQATFSLWTSPSWRVWLASHGYTLVDARQIPVERLAISVTVELWEKATTQSRPTSQDDDEEATTALEGEVGAANEGEGLVEYVLYHSALGQKPNYAGLYLAISGEAALDELLRELAQVLQS
jgi:hypothetical protein